MKRVLVVAAILVSCSWAAVHATAAAAPDTASTILKMMFTQKRIDPSAFSAEFTSRLPISKMQAAVDDYKARLGTLSSVEPDVDHYLLTFKRGSLLATIALDSARKVVRLQLHDEVSRVNTTALTRVLGAKKLSPDWFTAGFLAILPADRLNAELAKVRLQEGRFVRVDVRRGAYYAVYEKDENHTLITTDSAGKIISLSVFAPATPALR